MTATTLFFSFSGVYFFNALQTVDFVFLNKSFYNFYPVIKFMVLRDIITKGLNINDYAMIRNSFIFGETFKEDSELKH